MPAAFTKGARVSEKGQFTLPKKLRERYNIGKGSRLRFIPMDDGIKILISEPLDIENFCGFIKADGKQDFDEMIHEAKMRRANENY